MQATKKTKCDGLKKKKKLQRKRANIIDKNGLIFLIYIWQCVFKIKFTYLPNILSYSLWICIYSYRQIDRFINTKHFTTVVIKAYLMLVKLADIFNLVQFSHPVMSDSLRPQELQHTRPPCPLPTPGVHLNPGPSSWWCHPTISASVVPFFSCPQSFPASGSFQMSQLFTWGGQSIGV